MQIGVLLFIVLGSIVLLGLFIWIISTRSLSGYHQSKMLNYMER